MKYLGRGERLSTPGATDGYRGAGISEPSLTRFGGRFFLTLRTFDRGDVCTGGDGLHFSAPVPWRFDDGAELGNHNTQQHWAAYGGKLFLLYTRRGAGNDGPAIFRHRAPLFMAEVNPETPRVIRASERVVLPKLPAGFGNFGAAPITPDETWVVAGRRAAEAGTPSLYVARLR